jgi:integrase
MSKLSSRKIDSLKADPTKVVRVSDGQGMYVNVSKTGNKTFTFRFVYGSGRHELTLGTYPELSLAEAREKRLEASKVLEGGRNPLHVEQLRKETKREALNVNELIQEFHDQILVHQFERPKKALDVLLLHVGTQIGKLLAADVTKRDIALMIGKIVARGSKVSANRTLTLTRRMFDYAKDRDIVQESPVVLSRKNAGGKEKARTMHLEFEDIQHFLKVLDSTDTKLSWQCRMALKLLLATAKRPGEIVTVEWTHLDLDKGIWKNPEHLTKEKRGLHTIFLNPFAVRLLREVQLTSGRCQHVFISPRDPEVHIDRHSLSRAVQRLRVEDKLLKVTFTPHDLRRTFSSRMADMGVMPHVVEKILDHQMEGVMAVYNKSNYYPEREAAMILWGKKLDELSKS